MRREILAGLIIVVSLCACSNTLNNQPDSQSGETRDESYKTISAINNSEKTENKSSAAEDDRTASNLAINWGEYSDSLKCFDDHDGRKNNYKDYIMTTQVEMNGKKSKALSLNGMNVGSMFLTSFQEREIVKERPIPPKDETKVTLTVTETGTPYWYSFYESGRIYTQQNGKTYYLGDSTFFFQDQIIMFLVAAFQEVTEEQTGVPQLPPLDPWDYHISSDVESGASKHKTDFTPEKYDVAIILTDYEKLSVPILIKDATAEEKILDCLNKTNQTAEIKVVTGGAGPIVRVFNKTECFNYLNVGEGDQLLDYQNELVYTLPEDLIECLYLSLTYEMACIFEEK
ncbi:MAG: hypothetical protein ACERKO_03225 [Acetanaerobacterium sp.]